MRINTGSPVTGDDLFGRKKELERMESILSNPSNSILIPGPRRIGKSSLVKEFIRIQKGKYKIIYFELEGKNSILELCSDIYKELKKNYIKGIDKSPEMCHNESHLAFKRDKWDNEQMAYS